MLRKPLLSAISLICLVGSAYAADLPSRKALPPAPSSLLVPVSSWTGFYVGVNAGGAFSGSSTISLTPSSDFGPFPSGFASAQAVGAYPISLNSRRTSFIGGGQASASTTSSGCSSRASKPTFRVCHEEIPYRRRSSIRHRPPAISAAPVFGTATVARRLDYLGTARGRLGVTFGPALIYATGGLAYGRTDLAYAGTIGFPSRTRLSLFRGRHRTAEPASATPRRRRGIRLLEQLVDQGGVPLLQSRPLLDDDWRQRSPISLRPRVVSRPLRCVMTAISFAPA